ncbi:MAG: tetratricopeptide repeat protein [Alphaproteobacteria bacterium]|nr:tetratricopeptide repeat protein [Alphaproteobacteria bacterium]
MSQDRGAVPHPAERRSAERILEAAAKSGEGPLDLAEAALALAALDHPGKRLSPYRAHLAALVAEVGAAPGDSLAGKVGALQRVLVEHHGYHGDADTYDDLRNADLMAVIDRKKGLPVALAIVTMHVARAQGWTMVGLNFPGHFLVRLDDGGERAILDPFHRMRVLEPGHLRTLLKSMAGLHAELSPEHYAPMADRDVLVRLANNVKIRAVQAGDSLRALAVLQRMLLFAPDRIIFWREIGVLEAQAGNLRRAIEATEEFIGRCREGPDRRQAEAYIERLRTSLN